MHSQLREEQLALRRTRTGEYVKDRQELRHLQREARWYLQDGSRAKLPITSGHKATELLLELAGIYSLGQQRQCLTMSLICRHAVSNSTANFDQSGTLPEPACLSLQHQHHIRVCQSCH